MVRRTAAVAAGLLAALQLAGSATALMPSGAASDDRAARPGIVRANGRAFADDRGPFLALGTTLFWGLWGYEHDRPRLARNLDAVGRAGFDYIRVLAIVGPDGWTDRVVDARSDRWTERVSAFTDWAYDTYGLRVQWTVFGGIDTTPTASSRARAVQRFAAALKGRHHKVFGVEIANEGYKNGFPGEEGRTELKRLAARLRSAYPGLIATTAPPEPSCSQRSAYYGRSRTSFVTLHLPRGDGDGDPWDVVRGPWRTMAANCRGVPEAYSSNEPIGPYSSVSEERDPLRLAMMAAVSWTSGIGAYVLHTGAGIRGGGREDQERGRPADLWEVENWPQVTAALDCVRATLPSDVPRWKRVVAGDQPFDAQSAARAPEGPLMTVGRAGEFVTVAAGLRPAASLVARRAITLRAVNPLSCEPGEERTLRPGERLAFEETPAALIIRGKFAGPGKE